MTSLNFFQRSCLILTSILAIVMPLQAATITVNSNTDTLNNNLSTCTLRDAVASANLDTAVAGCTAGTGEDTILVGNRAIVLMNGALIIETDITVIGSGQNQTEINGNNSSRIFNILNDGNLTLEDITLSGGSASGNFSSGSGGAISIFSAFSELTINNSTLSGNSSNIDGGAIYVSAAFQLNININNSILSNNSAGRDGGAISSENVGLQLNLNINNSTLSNNSSERDGGAIAMRPPGQWFLNINNSTLSNNSSGRDGGAVMTVDVPGESQRDVTIENSTLSNNSSEGRGGAVQVMGDLTLINSTISGNTAVESGGGVNFLEDENVFIEGVTIINSTITGNTSSSGGGGVSIFSNVGEITITNSIISGNTTSLSDLGDGDEIVIGNNTATLTVTNSLLGANGIDNSEAFINLTPNTSNNIIATSDGNVPTPLASILAPLANNGGLTQTHGLLEGSPAVNSGDATLCPATDQRGEPRVDDCDIGAFEGVVEGPVENGNSLFVIPLPDGKTVIFGL